MRKALIIANWKMKLGMEEARRLTVDVRLGLAGIRNVDLAVCPSFLHLSAVGFQLPSNIRLGAQDCFWEKSGNYTGEISAIQLKEAGCGFVIIGHSERRKFLKENDVMISSKVEAVLGAEMIPVLCVGESLEEREKKLAASRIAEQVEIAIQDLTREQIRKMVIAYEPIWAIGTGRPATGEDARQVAKFIRRILNKKYDDTTAQMVKVLYGGSVSAANIRDFVSLPLLDGALVGGASLKADEFINIVKNVAK